jgi:thioredoxin 1
MTKPFAVTDQTFEATVVKAETPVLVDFGADWCPPCHRLDPVLDELAQELDGQLVISKLDVDENPHAAMHYGVMGLPTLLLFKNGEPVDRIVGFQPKAQLLKRLQLQLNQ